MSIVCELNACKYEFTESQLSYVMTQFVLFEVTYLVTDKLVRI